MIFSTRVTELLGIRYPIVQAGMSWASSNAELALAVSQAGALGMIAAGPMSPDALRAAIRAVKARTDKPFAVNVPLYNQRAAAFLDIVLENEFTRAFEAAERSGAPAEELATLNSSRTLKMAAFDGDVEQGKVEVGQSVGLIDELMPAATVVARLISELEGAVGRLSRFRC